MQYIIKAIAQINYVLADYRKMMSEEEIETLRSARIILLNVVKRIKDGNLPQDSDAI